MDRLITTPEIAASFQVSVNTVNVWIRRGLLPAEKLGPIWIVREQDLAEFTRPTRGRPKEKETNETPNHAEVR